MGVTAKFDKNFIHSTLAVSSTDKSEIRPLLVNPITGELLVEMLLTPRVDTGLDHNKNFDDNHRKVSKGYDGTKARPLLVDENSKLLVETTIN